MLALSDAVNSGAIPNAEIVIIISDKADAPGLELARERGVVRDRHTRPRYAGGVDVAHVLYRPHRLGSLDRELSALVFQERPVPEPQDLDPFEGVQKIRDAHGRLIVRDFQRDLAYRGVPPDVDRCHVPDQTAPRRDSPGDPGKLARAVRGRWPPIKILVVSGKVRLRPSELPSSSRFVGKPYRAAAMVEELRSLIERRDPDWRQYVPEAIHDMIEEGYPAKLRVALRGTAFPENPQEGLGFIREDMNPPIRWEFRSLATTG